MIDAMMDQGILPGLALSHFAAGHVSEAENTLLIAVTEKRTPAEIARYVSVLSDILKNSTQVAS